MLLAGINSINKLQLGKLLLIMAMVFGGSLFFISGAKAFSPSGVTATSPVSPGQTVYLNGYFYASTDTAACNPTHNELVTHRAVSRTVQSLSHNIVGPENKNLGSIPFNPNNGWYTVLPNEVIVNCGHPDPPGTSGAQPIRYRFFNVPISTTGLSPGSYQVRISGSEVKHSSCHAGPWTGFGNPYGPACNGLNFSNTVVATFTVSAPVTGSVRVTSNISTGWHMDGPGTNNWTDSGTDKTKTGQPVGTYKLNPDEISGCTHSVSGASFNGTRYTKELTSGTLTFNIVYNCPAPGAFTIPSGGCFGWPSPKIENNPNSSSNADDYSLQRRTNGGSWQTILSHVSLNTIDNYADSVSQNNTYEYRVIAYNDAGSTYSSNTRTYVSNGASCGGGYVQVSCSVPGASWTVSGGLGSGATPSSTHAAATGSYTVTFNAVSGYTTSPPQGANVTAGNTAYVACNYAPTYSISGYVFNDHNGNGSYANPDTPVSGATVYLYNLAGTQILNQTTTNGSGAYSIGNISAGSYRIVYFVPSGYTATTDNSHPFSVGPNTTWNFGFETTPPNTATITSVSNSTCSQLGVNWSYTSNGVSHTFQVWRSTSPAAGFANVSGNLSSALRTWTDTSVAVGTSYYYQVKAVTTNTPVKETTSNTFGPTLNVGCSANLNNSTKAVTLVNGQAYNSNTVIEDGDVITYQITINNSGTAAASISYICEYPASVLDINSGSLNVSGGGTNGGITNPSASCISGGNQYPRLNVSGSKPSGGSNWIVTFTTTYDAGSASYDICSTNSVIYFSDPEGSKTKSLNTTTLCGSSGGGAPVFEEVGS